MVYFQEMAKKDIPYGTPDDGKGEKPDEKKKTADDVLKIFSHGANLNSPGNPEDKIES